MHVVRNEQGRVLGIFESPEQLKRMLDADFDGGHCGFCSHGHPSPANPDDPESFHCEEPQGNVDIGPQRAAPSSVSKIEAETKQVNRRFFDVVIGYCPTCNKNQFFSNTVGFSGTCPECDTFVENIYE